MEQNPQFNDILLYSTPQGKVKIEVLYEGETFWLNQKRMAEMFNVSIQTINEHLKSIFQSGELQENSVVSILEITAKDGKNYPTQFYNLDAIIAVGYRVNSKEATKFRVWATQTLKEFIIKGFVLDDERLKQGKKFGQDFFLTTFVLLYSNIRPSLPASFHPFSCHLSCFHFPSTKNGI